MEQRHVRVHTDYLAELERLQPETLAACDDAVSKATNDLDFIRLDEASLAKANSISIDYAVMEHTAKAVVIPAEMDGTMLAGGLRETSIQDADGNTAIGDAEGRRPGVIFEAKMPVLSSCRGWRISWWLRRKMRPWFSPRRKPDELRTSLRALRLKNAVKWPSTVAYIGPGATRKSVDLGERFKVKRLVVNPGGNSRCKNIVNGRSTGWS